MSQVEPVPEPEHEDEHKYKFCRCEKAKDQDIVDCSAGCGWYRCMTCNYIRESDIPCPQNEIWRQKKKK